MCSFPKGWEVKKLGEVITLEYGKPLDKYKRIDKGQYPVYGANGIKAKTNEYYYDKKTIIVGRKGSAGEINLTEERFWPLDVSYFVKFEKKQIDLYFLYFWLSKLNLPKLAKGVKPGINRNDVYDLAIPLPPLPEQKRIVAILEKAFTAIDQAKANTEKNLKNARELFQSKLQETFANGKLKIDNGEWEEKKLGEVCDVLDKLRKPITKSNRIEGEYPYYGATGILSYVHEYIFDEKLVLIGEDGAKWKSGDNSSFIVSGKYWVNNHAHVIRPMRGFILDEWVVNFLNFSDLTKYITGMTVLKLNQKKMKNIPIPLPPLPEQKQIVKKLDSVSTETKKLEAIYQRKINCLDELKKSILQKAFNGEL